MCGGGKKNPIDTAMRTLTFSNPLNNFRDLNIKNPVDTLKDTMFEVGNVATGGMLQNQKDQVAAQKKATEQQAKQAKDAQKQYEEQQKNAELTRKDNLKRMAEMALIGQRRPGGGNSTILTSPFGVTSNAPTFGKTLLGQ